MKKIFFSLLAIFFVFFGKRDVFGYELSEQDIKLINSVQPKIDTVIDTYGGETAGRFLDYITATSQKYNDERIIKILNQVHKNIDTKYEVGKYVVANSSTPVLYTPDFKAQFGGNDGSTLNFDRFGEIDALEFVAFKNTVFELKDELDNDIYEVITVEYPVENPLYIHKDFVGNISRVQPESRIKILPSKEKILENLRSMQGADYVWGGNDPAGIPKMLELYPPSSEISPLKKGEWQLKGVDCSGLIYAATGGYTPRNTSWLVNYGESLDIADKNLDQIVSLLKPLDIIVWRGHMLVVYSETETIESAVSFSDPKLKPGVQIRDIRDSLGEVMNERTPVNNYDTSNYSRPFVIIRWYE